MKNKCIYFVVGLLVYWFIYAPTVRPAYGAWIEECTPPSKFEEWIGKIFNRLPFRPFPFKSCQNIPPTGDTCNAGLELTKIFELPRADPIKGDPNCHPEKPAPGDQVSCTRDVSTVEAISIDLSKAELPLDMTCPDGPDQKCKDSLPTSEQMNYLQSWLAGIFQGSDLSPAKTDTNEEQINFVTNAGALKKLIPNLDDYKAEIAKAAAEKKIYDQDVCYVKNSKVISRKEAESEGYDDKYTLADFVLRGKLKPRPGDEPWYTCWLQSQYTQTADLRGTLSLGTISTSLHIPQVLQINKETDLFSQVFIPQEAQAKLTTEGDPCDPKKAVRFAQRGDKFIEGQAITLNVPLKKEVTYEYRELTEEEKKFYIKNGEPLPTTVEVEVSFPIPMKLQVPKEAGQLTEKIAGIAQAKVPTSINNASLQIPIGASCAGANCTMEGGVAFPQIGGGINSANVLAKCALNPLYQGPECQIETAVSKGKDGDVNCDQTAPDITFTNLKTRDETEQLALNWQPGVTDVNPKNHVQTCYNDVIKRAQSKGINPAFALMIWINESNGSNYNISLQDFGVNKKALERDFDKQITAFLDLPAFYKSGFPQCFGHGLSDMEAFARIFKNGNCDADPSNYYQNILDVWPMFTSCPLPKYPTDTSCP